MSNVHDEPALQQKGMLSFTGYQVARRVHSSMTIICGSIQVSGRWRRGSASTSPGEEEERRKLMNCLLHRAGQRGLLELDLLLGEWAEEELPRMSLSSLIDFSKVLDEDSMEVYKWVTGQVPVPEHIQQNGSFKLFQARINARIHQNNQSAARTPSGISWVRGWHDKGNQ